MNNPFDYFDHIFCINLDKRTDRWETCQIEFDKIGIKDRVERFPAIESESGRNGCGMSHIEVVKLCKENNYKRPLILEDDFLVLDNAEENLAKSLEEFKTIENWSMLYIGCTLNAYPTHKFNNLITTTWAATTSSYILNPLLYDYVIEEASKGYYDNFKNHTPPGWAIDDWYVLNIQRQHNHNITDIPLYTYLTTPMIMLQGPSFSDIENCHTAYSSMQMDRYNLHMGIN